MLFFASFISLVGIAAAAVHDVEVGPNDALVYQPPTVLASVGDTVRFLFTNKNFTATQSSFAAPCVATKGGINSGFVAVSPGTEAAKTFSFLVKDVKPTIFFSEQADDCELGMIFTLNASANETAAAIANAESNKNAANTTATGSSSPKNFQVQVGPNDALVYSPSTVIAAPGDSVTFVFTSKNFTVTQSSLGASCVAKKGGVNSGFVPVLPGSDAQTFTIKVNDTKPATFFSAQGQDCELGMVFNLNPSNKVARMRRESHDEGKVVKRKAHHNKAAAKNGAGAVARGTAGALFVVGAMTALLIQ